MNLSARTYESFALAFIALLFGVGGIYSYKIFSFLMPLLTIVMIWNRGGMRDLSFQLSPPFVVLLLLLIWSGVSIFWTTHQLSAVGTFIPLTITFIFSILFLLLIGNSPPDLTSRAYRILKISGCILILLILVQVVSDFFHMGLIKKYKGEPYMMKPTGLILGLTAFVGCAFLWINGNKVLSILVSFLVSILVYLTHCETGVYGVLFAGCIFILSYMMPFWTTRVAMVTSYTFLILSPLLSVYVFAPTFPSESIAFAKILSKSFLHRVLAWEYFSMRFFESPFLGWGFESSRYLQTDPDLAQGYTRVVHPHNNAVQLYAELGILGGVLIALFFASLFWVVEKHVKDRLSVAVCNATITFCFITAEITHNVWRNYWLSLVTLTVGMVILFIKAREAQLRGKADHSRLNPVPEKGWRQQKSFGNPADQET